MLKELQIYSIYDMIEGNYKDAFKDYHIISIRDSGTNSLYTLLDSQLKNNVCTSYLVKKFDDIVVREKLKKLVEMNDIVDILNFAKDKDKLIVHCNMGVSRSSACAFLIKYQECKNIEESLSILDIYIHAPNIQIIKLGAEIFQNEEILTAIREFKTGIKKLGWSYY